MIIFTGVILAGFLSLILIRKKGKTLADKILLTWLISIAITLILFKLQTKEVRSDFPFFLGMTFPFPLLQWPFLYLYVLFLTSKESFRVKHLLHFIPFLLSILLFSRYLLLADTEKLLIYNKDGEGYEIEMTINLIAIILSAIFYTVLSSIKLWKYKQSIKNEFSYSEKITLNWMFYLLIGMTCILFMVLLGPNDQYIFSAVSGMVLFIGYFGIKQVGIFNQNVQLGHYVDSKSHFSDSQGQLTQSEILSSQITANSLHEMAAEVQKVKYEKSKISEQEKNSIHQRLTELMQKEQLYKNPQLTLSEVAQKISVHPNILSQIINSVEEKNFYDYINFQRIEEFKRIVFLPRKNQYTLLSLAYECGFNSKTSFNRNFKKVTNLSPTEYLKLKNIQLQD